MRASYFSAHTPLQRIRRRAWFLIFCLTLVRAADAWIGHPDLEPAAHAAASDITQTPNLRSHANITGDLN